MVFLKPYWWNKKNILLLILPRSGNRGLEIQYKGSVFWSIWHNRNCKDETGRRVVKWYGVWEKIPAPGATGPLWSCPEKGRQLSACQDREFQRKIKHKNFFREMSSLLKCPAKGQRGADVMCLFTNGSAPVSLSPVKWKQPRLWRQTDPSAGRPQPCDFTAVGL